MEGGAEPKFRHLQPRHDRWSSILTPLVRQRQLSLVLLLALLIVLPRSLYIAHSHSESYDDDYHLRRGLRFWTRSLAGLDLNDPPLGQAITALPLLPFAWPVRTDGEFSAIHDLRGIGPQAARMLVAGWKSLLFLPLVGVVFCWSRQIYGPRSAWLAAALLLVEPTVGAHVAVAAIDVIGVEGIVIACFFAWRFFAGATGGTLLAASAALALGMLLKHTAIILPGVVLVLGTLVWLIRPRLQGISWREIRQQLRARIAMLALAGVLTAAFIWAFTLFDVSRPTLPKGQWSRLAWKVSKAPLPAGIYVRSVFEASAHGAKGHNAYLLGESSRRGWWHYYPVMMWFKVPVGVAIVLAIGLLSLAYVRPRWEEWSLLVPMLAWCIFLVASPMNLGFRHFLPAYVFMLLLAARCVTVESRVPLVFAWAGVVVAAIHTAAYLPDWTSYVNWPRRNIHLKISDSNLDWGQALPQVGNWVDEHGGDRPIYLKYFGTPHRMATRVDHYVGDRVTLIAPGQAPPDADGLLIISPVWVTGAYLSLDGRLDVYGPLRAIHPRSVIGHSMLVYEMSDMEMPSAASTRDAAGKTH